MTGVTAETADSYARVVEQLAKVRAIVFRSDTQQARIRDLVELLDPAIAAQQPQAAPGDAQLRMALAFIEQARDGAYGDLGTIDAEQSLREIADAAPAQPAPGDLDAAYLYHWRFDRGEEFGLYRHREDADAKAAEHAGAEVLSMAILGEQPAPASASQARRLTEQQAAPELAKLREQLAASDRIIRDILESLCRRDGLSLDSTVEPGEPARNYALAERLGIGHVFGLPPLDAQ